MPKITIKEIDKTSSGESQLVVNTAYVPGYAVMGPVNVPTYCETVEEFQSIFGTRPYKFEENSSVSGITAVKGSYEKSYIYAVELLNKGLPIIFERVFDASKIEQFKASANLSANVKGNYDEITEKYGTNEFSVFAEVAESSSDDFASYFIKDGDTYKVPEGAYDAEVTYYTKTDVTLSRTSEETAYYILSESVYVAISPAFVADTAEDFIVIKAKNPGKYGTEIYYEVADNLDGTFSISAQLHKDETLGTLQLPESGYEELLVSFDSASEYYFDLVKNKAELFDLELLPDKEISGSETLNVVEIPSPLSLTGVIGKEFSLDIIYGAFSSIFDKLADRNQFKLKFITSGSYPVLEYDENKVANKMLLIAGNRGNSIALIDHLDAGYTASALLTEVGKLDKEAKTLTEEDPRKYGALFTPWALYTSRVLGSEFNSYLPASFAYLKCFAQSIKNNPTWYAAAGVARGLVSDLLQVKQEISGVETDKLQLRKGLSVNPIVNIRPYGYCIWGNRTLNENEKDLVASSFLNVRSLVCDVKEIVYETAKKLTFENNSDILWLNFKSSIEPTLDQMVTGNGLVSYKIIKKETTKKATVAAIIRLVTIEAVEDWDLTIELTDSYVTVE